MTEAIRPAAAIRRLEISRRIWHVGTGCLAAGIYHFAVPEARAPWVMLPVALAFTAVETARHLTRGRPGARAFHEAILRLIGRIEERYSVSSMVYFVWGVFLAVLFSSKGAAVAAILMLALGDPMAGLIGTYVRILSARQRRSRLLWIRASGLVNRAISAPIRLGRLSLGKSAAGTAANFAVCAAIAFARSGSVPAAAVVASVVAAVELLSFRAPHLLLRPDDNLTVPLCGALVMHMVTG